MRQSLRRSCAACAKAKHSCDLRTPRCSRCIKRKLHLCVYANEPLTAPPAIPVREDDGPLVGGVQPRHDEGHVGNSADGPFTLSSYTFGSLDPFESYPQTRLPREHVQRLIHSFLHKIAFQYYPLDLSTTSNPFLISWWPLALGDPALFHVSLQTASLDEELIAQKGFQTSGILMADSVALLRRKIRERSLAVQDGTMDSVITLAAIEFGMGNIKVANMHVDGVKGLVKMRGGINAVRQTSPLTARMISWVSMLVVGHPQFDTQDDVGIGDGIPPIPEWQLDHSDSAPLEGHLAALSNHEVRNVFIRLRNVFQKAERTPLPATRLHDLTCFVIHRLLSLSAGDMGDYQSSPVSQCVRYAIMLYMFIVQGPTYYSHAVIMNTLVAQFMEHLKQFYSDSNVHDELDVWLIAIGVAASTGTPQHQWFMEKALAIVVSLQLRNWSETVVKIKKILWLETSTAEDRFRPPWDTIFAGSPCEQQPKDLTLLCVSPNNAGV